MTGFLTDKCEEVRKWLAIGSDVYPDAVVTGWVRMAEEYLSNVLRVKHMVQIDTCTLTAERVPLPRDWQEIRFARLLPGGTTCRYQTPDAFFNPEYPNAPTPPYTGKTKKYTIIGNFIVVGEVTPSPGLQVELTYYQNIPPLSDELNNWINIYHTTVYTLKILHVASMYSIEDERSGTWDKEVTRSINEMNTAHKIDMASGSVLMPVRRKTFG
jgi:hypothetical protein